MCSICGPGVRVWKGGARRERWRCKNRVRAQVSREKVEDPARGRERKWKGHGVRDMTVARYDHMLETQDGRCKLCRREVDGPLVVDHNHETGEVRGLLCSTCNTGLGKFGDDPTQLRAALAYLETSQRPSGPGE